MGEGGAGLKPWLCAAAVIMRRALWFPLLVFLAHELAANAFRVSLYDVWPWIDIPMHFLGGFAIAYFIARSVGILAGSGLLDVRDVLAGVALVFGLTSTATILWEFAEWVSDRFLGTMAQVSLDDTMLDMFMGLVGGLACILFSELQRHVRRVTAALPYLRKAP